MGYIESRKKAYAPQYFWVVTQTAAFKALKGRINDGQSGMLLEFDGPREGGPTRGPRDGGPTRM